MVTNNGTLEVYNDTYAYSFNNNEIKALNTTNKGIIILKNKVKNKKRTYINDIIKN